MEQKMVGRVEFCAPDAGVDHWQEFLTLCLYYAEIARQRAAEMEASANGGTDTDAKAA
jgi:hypothetical protein